MDNTTRKNELIFLEWTNKLESLISSARSSEGQSLLKHQTEQLIINPAKLALCLRHHAPQPRKSTFPWDEAGNITLLKNSGKLYRQFRVSKSGKGSNLNPFPYQFLVYKRYNTKLITEEIPTDKLGNPVSGLQGVLEILYCPNANLAEEGRRIQIRNRTAVIETNSNEESRKLIGESLTLSQLIPLGTKGFYLFCSEQQTEPYKIEAGLNERIVMGPTNMATQIRVAYMVNKLGQGRPEKTNVVLQDVQNAYGKILLKILEGILLETSNPKDYFSKTEEDLHIKKKNWEQQVVSIQEKINERTSIAYCPNTIGGQGAIDNAITINFGDPKTNENEIEDQLLESLKVSQTELA